ncbi:MAG: hypothetical protein KAT00_01495 [Planctomycetes bacterium]|nr:hypothetical protein [Planctomycetota bacterium]
MNAEQVQQILTENFREQSHNEVRKYLGMSSIGRCPREQYFNVVDPGLAGDRLSWYGMIGYSLEERVIERLGAEQLVANVSIAEDYEHQIKGVLQVTRTIVADFDSRYRGHTDHEMDDGTLIEIKTITWDGYFKRWRERRGKWDHFAQCQAYMQHGYFDHCVLIYTPRDIPWRAWEGDRIPIPFLTLDVRPNRKVAKELDERAQRILRAIDDGVPPECGCGWCER